MAKSLGPNTPLDLAEFLAAVQAELDAGADAEENDLRFGIASVTLEVDVSSTLSISPESPRRLSVQLNRTSEARAVDEPDGAARLPASQATPTASSN
jgi:hypothetical protein